MIHTSSRRTSKSTSGLQCQSNWMMRASSTSPRATVIAYRYTAAQPKCCAPQLPRQFGEVELVVFACDIVLETLVLFLKRSTKEMGYGFSHIATRPGGRPTLGWKRCPEHRRALHQRALL